MWAVSGLSPYLPPDRISVEPTMWVINALAGRGTMPASRRGVSSHVPWCVSKKSASPIPEALAGLIRASARRPIDIAARGTCRTFSGLPAADSKAATTCLRDSASGPPNSTCAGGSKATVTCDHSAATSSMAT